MSDKDTIKQNEDELLIQKEFDELLQAYINSNHRKKVDVIKKAFSFAHNAHKDLRRRSGEPYIMHPIAVAKIVHNEIGLGSTSISAALLHDVVEDTEYTYEDIENHFGPKIASIVEGLTKISGGVFGERASEQAENFRKLLLTMSEDIRVILIKIADRLHNMRTLGSMPPAKQYKIAGETEYIYAPLAHRLGLFRIKTELENLSFKYEHPDTYQQIQTKLDNERESLDKFYTGFSTPIFNKLQEQGYRFELMKRIKSVYSIWHKMSIRSIPFEEVYDILALRIVFEPKPEIDEAVQCWMIYSAITSIYKPHPERIRDWISTPKANGYEALHVTVMTPAGRWVEIQIRSRRMHDIAERGLAAHWKYKAGSKEETESELDKWLKTIKELLENPEPNAIDFMDTFKLNLFSSEIFVFTPKGDIKIMPKDSTVLDFAYSVHSDIGNQCIAAKINHKLVPLNHKLSSGDQVEVLTSKKQIPQREWLDYITTGHARSKLMHFLKKEEKKQLSAGMEAFNKIIADNNIQLSKENSELLLEHLNVSDLQEIYMRIATEQITEENILEPFTKPKSTNIISRIWKNPFASSQTEDKKDKSKVELPSEKQDGIHNFDFNKTYVLKELDLGKAYQLAECCHPIPGDDILGYVNDDSMLIIHKRSCKLANMIKANFGNRLIDVEWGAHQAQTFVEKIEIEGIDRPGLLIDILRIISDQHTINIHRVAIDSNNGVFKGFFEIFVAGTDDINNLIKNILKIDEVNSVHRLEQEEVEEED